MSAIPSSDMPGYKRLHERACEAFDRCQESQGVDFKESACWEALKWNVMKTILAMANLRDGGIIVIGASERGPTWELTGISAENLTTYEVDTIINQTNSYASPTVQIDIVTVHYRNERTFLVVQIHEFLDSPIVCRKGGEDLIEGAVYVRPPGLAQTTRVMNASHMQDLLELAAEKRARRILEQGRRVGLVPARTAQEQFDEEVEGL